MCMFCAANDFCRLVLYCVNQFCGCTNSVVLYIGLPEWWGNQTVFHLLYLPPIGQPFDYTSVLSRSLCNTICSMLFSSCFDHEDKHLVSITWLFHDNFQIINNL